MNPTDAEAARLAQEASVLLKRTTLISQEADRFSAMAKKLGGQTKPALKLLAESDRLKGEAARLKAQADNLLAQSQSLLPEAEIIELPTRLQEPLLNKFEPDVVDVEPSAAPPKPVEPVKLVEPMFEPPPLPKSAAPNPRPVPIMPKPAVVPLPAASQKVTSPAPSAPPSPVIREVNRFPVAGIKAAAQPVAAPPAEKTEKPSGFFSRLFGFGKPKLKPARPAMQTTRPPAKPVPEIPKPASEMIQSAVMPKPLAAPPAPPARNIARKVEPAVAAAAPRMEAPKPVSAVAPPARIVSPSVEMPSPAAEIVPPNLEIPTPEATKLELPKIEVPRIVEPVPAPPRVEKPLPPPPAAPAPPRFATSHCQNCEQGVEFEVEQLPEDGYVVDCPNCGEKMKLSVP